MPKVKFKNDPEFYDIETIRFDSLGDIRGIRYGNIIQSDEGIPVFNNLLSKSYANYSSYPQNSREDILWLEGVAQIER